MITLVNCTPHAVNLRAADGTETVVPPSGTLARVKNVPGAPSKVDGIPVDVWSADGFGEIENLPAAEEGKLNIVSAVVGAALQARGQRREDVLVLGTGPSDGAIRDEQNRIVAVTRLKRLF